MTSASSRQRWVTERAGLPSVRWVESTDDRYPFRPPSLMSMHEVATDLSPIRRCQQ